MNPESFKCELPFQSVRVHFLERDSHKKEDKLIFFEKRVKTIFIF